MTTLFTPEARPARTEPSMTLVVIYALAGLVWLGLAFGNFRDGRHASRAWAQVIAGVLYLISMAIYLSRLLKDRKAT